MQGGWLEVPTDGLFTLLKNVLDLKEGVVQMHQRAEDSRKMEQTAHVRGSNPIFRK